MRAVLMMAAVLGMAAAPPARLTPGQQEMAEERDGLRRLAHERWDEGDAAGAVAAMGKALALSERLQGRHSRQAHGDSSWLAFWEGRRGRWADAVKHFARLEAIDAALWGEGDWRTADMRWYTRTAGLRAGWSVRQNKDWDESIRLVEEAGALRQKGRQAAAVPLMSKAVGLRRSLVGEVHTEHAQALNNLGTLYLEVGDRKAALPTLLRARAIFKEALGERHPEYASALNNLALVMQDAGDHKAGMRLLREAGAIYTATYGEGHPSTAINLSNLALLYRDMGDRKAALPLFRRSLASLKGSLGERNHSYATTLNNLALLLGDLGEHEDALTKFRQSLAICKATRGPKHPEYASTLGNIASLLAYMGRHGEALDQSRQALGIIKDALGEKHHLYALCLNNLARQHADAGDNGAALPLFEKALAINKEALGTRHPRTAAGFANLGRVQHALKHDGAALRHAEQGLALAAAHLRDLASVQSDRQQLAAAAALRYHLDGRLALPDAEGHPVAAAHVLAWKGAVLLRQQQRRLSLRLADDPATRRVAERLQAVTRELASLRHAPSAARGRLEALEKEQDDVQARLHGLSAAFREARELERPTPEKLAKALPAGSALIDYIFANGRLLAFVHRRGEKPARFDLGKAGTAEGAVREWRRALAGRRPDRVAGLAVKRLLLAPLEAHLKGAEVLLVSPDGALGTVPFAALPGGKGDSYLIEEVALAVVPAPQMLTALLAPGKKGGRLEPSLLVAGDLRYDPGVGVAPPAGEDSRSAPRTGREKFGRLGATKAEIQAVKASFSELFRKGEVVDLRGGDATKKAVRRALGEVRYAHLATHGFFAPEEAGGAARGHGAERGQVTGWHPLLLSGLALSDANREPKSGEEDGILTALEVSEMDLTRLELAVLSACETGLGEVAGGEGLLGMQRAFQAAGARSVIASLWKVDDRATQQLMTDFYAAAWDTGKIVSRAAALRAAQLAMLRDGRLRGIGKDAGKVEAKGARLPPYYWAAFVLSGDWR